MSVRMLAAFLILFAVLAAAQPPTALDISSPQASPSALLKRTNGTCNFVYTGARYSKATAEITLQGVRDEVLLNDALIRALRSTLDLASCQLAMSQGVNCSSGTQQLPCSDPVFNCGQGIVISEDVYEAVNNGDCSGNSTAANTLVCATVANNPAIAAAVGAGSCRPACISGSGSTATQEFPVWCISYNVAVDTETEDDAKSVTAALGDPIIQTNIAALVGNYTAANGVQFLVVNSGVNPAVGFGYFPPPPPPLKIISNGSSTYENSTASALASAGKLVYGPWSDCYPACGKGYSTRTASCYSPDGTLLPLMACPGGDKAETSQPCESNSTCSEEAYWEYSSWSPCNATCDGGVATRSATCIATGDAQCNVVPIYKMKCNTAPCNSYSWSISAWGDCTVACGGGSRTRTVECLDRGGAPVDGEKCTGKKPRSNEQCNVQPCEFCTNNTCLGRGTCIDNVCKCRDNYSGARCETPGSCKSGVVDTNLACCASGLVDTNGTCCPEGSILDADGACCSQAIDVCGVCGGSGLFLDMQGTCCTVADANGVCCVSGIVDECGVCDGTGTSCAVQIVASVNVPTSLLMGNGVDTGVQTAPLTEYFQNIAASMGLPPDSITVGNISSVPPGTSTPDGGKRRLAQAPSPPASTSTVPLYVQVTVDPTAASNTTIPQFTSAYIAAEIPVAAANETLPNPTGLSIDGTPVGGRSGSCGNGICEIGERATIGAHEGTCPQDCGLPGVACVGGCGIGGNCLSSTGVCQCYLGYSGSNCMECSSGYIKSGAVCVPSVTDLRLVNSSVIGNEGQALVSGEAEDADGGDGTSAGVIAGAVIGGIAGLVLLIGSFVCLRKCLQNKREAQSNSRQSGGKMPSGAMVGYVVDGDEEIGLRQKYGLPSARGNGGVPGSGRSFNVHVDTGIPGGGGGYVSGQNTARSNASGWHSAREDAVAYQQQVYHAYQQKHYQSHGVVPLSARSDLTLSARSSLPAVSARGPASQRAYNTSARSYSGAPVASGPMPPSREDTRASLQSLTHSSGASASARDNVTSSTALDPDARLFFNPAFSMEGRPRPASAETSVGGPIDAEDRKAKLDALRATVKALEKQQAVPVIVEEAPGVHKKAFLPGRPSVPRLSLGSALLGNVAGAGPSRQNSVAQEELIKAHNSGRQEYALAHMQEQQHIMARPGSAKVLQPSSHLSKQRPASAAAAAPRVPEHYASIMAQVDRAIKSAESSPAKRLSARGPRQQYGY